MNTKMQEEILLIIPDKEDEERDVLAEIWREKYGAVLRVGKFWIKPDTQNKKVALYGYDSFCLVLAQILNLEMISPKDETICALEKKWTKRHIELKELGDIRQFTYPKFIKPAMPKLFKGKVYDSETAITEATTDIKPHEKIIVSDLIEVTAEIRTFVLDKKIQDMAFYEGNGDLDAARQFAEAFLYEADIELPRTFVLDLGHNPTEGWFIIEFNASWGAGLNFCAPEKVLDCIKEATQNTHKKQH